MNPSLASIESYDLSAERLCATYSAMRSVDVHAAFANLLPTGKVVLDVGAGSGRDAGHLASLGNLVVAVEPSRGMRMIGSKAFPCATPDGKGPGVVWVDDALPALPGIHSLDITFDFILVSAVWMHVAPEDRPEAFASLAGLLAPDGILAITLRLGEPDTSRAMYRAFPDEVRRFAANANLRIIRDEPAADLLERADVSWHNIAMRAPGVVA